MLGRAIRAFLTTVIVSLILTSCSAFFPLSFIPPELYVRSSGDVFDLLFCDEAVVDKIIIERRSMQSGSDYANVVDDEKILWETGLGRPLAVDQLDSDNSGRDLSALKVGDDLSILIIGTLQGEEFSRSMVISVDANAAELLSAGQWLNGRGETTAEPCSE